MEKYVPKYFSENEFKRLNCSLSDMQPNLLRMLDSLRENLGRPLFLSSAFRTVEHELQQGRSGTSAHCFGYAVDISCSSPGFRFDLVKEAIRLGFTRIGIGRNFVHLDISPNHTQRVIWHYY